MRILTAGGMEDFCTYLDINRTFFLICCMFCIFLPAEGNIISEVVGSTVILHCKNETKSTLVQLTWKMNGASLISFNPQKPLHHSKDADRLNITMSLSESQLYALVIDRVQKSHTGNYTCEINTEAGVQEQNWDLIITDHEEDHEEAGNLDKLVITVAVIVPCVCCLIFIIALAILLRVCKQREEGHSRTAEMEQEETIYENCLERHGYNQHHHYKSRSH